MSKVAIVTTTSYQDNEDGKLRRDLATQFFRKGSEKGHHIIAVEGSPDKGKYLEQIKSYGIHAFPETKQGLGHSRREALHYAYDIARHDSTPYLLWSEPEKVDMIEHIEEMLDYIKQNPCDVLAPTRLSMYGYPALQQMSEEVGELRHIDNGFVDQNGKPLDTFFGPKMWRTEHTPYFLVFGSAKVPQELTTMRLQRYKSRTEDQLFKDFMLKMTEDDLKRTDHMMHMPVCLMLLRGFKALSLEISYKHPKEQRDLEERNKAAYDDKRIMQLHALNEQFALVKRLHANKTLDEELAEYGIKVSA